MGRVHGQQLQYMHIRIARPEEPMYYYWDKYQEIFDQCPNLKAIEFEGNKSTNFITDVLPNLSENNQQIWNERLSYFQARNIRFTNLGEIRNNENLRKELEKEAGVTWSFHFDFDFRFGS